MCGIRPSLPIRDHDSHRHRSDLLPGGGRGGFSRSRRELGDSVAQILDHPGAVDADRRPDDRVAKNALRGGRAPSNPGAALPWLASGRGTASRAGSPLARASRRSRGSAGARHPAAAPRCAGPRTPSTTGRARALRERTGDGAPLLEHSFPRSPPQHRCCAVVPPASAVALGLAWSRAAPGGGEQVAQEGRGCRNAEQAAGGQWVVWEGRPTGQKGRSMPQGLRRESGWMASQSSGSTSDDKPTWTQCAATPALSARSEPNLGPPFRCSTTRRP
jgi:hypothetical protein